MALATDALARTLNSLRYEITGVRDNGIDAEEAQEWFHPGQLEAWHKSEPEIAIVAGTQAGKTAITPYWLLREVQRSLPAIKKIGYGKAIYVGPTLTLLRAQAISAFKRVFQEELQLGTLVESPKPVFTFSREGLIRLLGTDRYPVSVHFAYANDSSNLESMTAICAAWDEAGQSDNKIESYEALQRRLIAARSMGYGRVLYATTPYEWGWFKTRVVDRNSPQNPVAVVNYPSWMNPIVSEADCRRELDKGMPLWRWEMMYLGRFTKPAGMIYDCFDDDKNLCERFAIPRKWRRLQGVDFGNVNTAMVSAVEDPTENKIYVYRSYHGGSDNAEDHVKNFLNEEAMFVRTDDIFKPKGYELLPPIACGGAPSEDDWRARYQEAGYPISKPPIASVEAGIERVYALFKSGRLVIFDDLVKLIDEIRTYSRKINDAGEAYQEIDKKSTYHRVDALRYLSMLINLDELDAKPVIIKRSA